MTDTRPQMTRARFAEAAAYAYENWWLTGEDEFVHVPAVMEVDGWNLYGHPGNDQLTEPQRVLMMWSDLVGQTSNGGFTQFVYNYRYSLAMAHRLIAKLDWPELFERFDHAFREQVGDPENPRIERFEWGPEDDEPDDDEPGSEEAGPPDGEDFDEDEDEDPPGEAADAFDDWFYLSETKAASKVFVGNYILRHRDELCRLID